MGWFGDHIVGGMRSLVRGGFGEGSRHSKKRVLALGIFGIDVIASAFYVFIATRQPIDIQAWFEPGFPSNMVVLRNNEDGALEDVTLVLDLRYSMSLTELEPGISGLEVNREFRDNQNKAPKEDYRPERLIVHVDGNSVSFKLGERH